MISSARVAAKSESAYQIVRSPPYHSRERRSGHARASDMRDPTPPPASEMTTDTAAAQMKSFNRMSGLATGN
jgi:hypothetical protein